MITGLLHVFLKQLDHMYHMIGFGTALKFHLLKYMNYHAYSIFITIVGVVTIGVDVLVTVTEDLPFFFQGRRIYLKKVRIRIKTIQIYKSDSTPTLKISMST